MDNNYFVHKRSYIDDGVGIGKGTKIWHFCHIQRGAKIGSRYSLGQNVNVSNSVYIGNGVVIQNNVSVYEGVTLENHVFCGHSMVLMNDLAPRARFPKRSAGYKEAIVYHDTTIASGAVVTKKLPVYALMAGVPAKQIGWMYECGQVLRKQADYMKCPDCGKRYEMKNEKLCEIMEGYRLSKYLVYTSPLAVSSGRRAA